MTGYTLRLGCGIGLSLIWLWFAAPIFNIQRNHLVKWIWIISIVSLTSGRMGYGLMHTAYFIQNPLHLFQLNRTGGIHGESALLGGLASLGIWAANRNKRNSFSKKDPKTFDTHSFEHLTAFFTPAILCVAAGAWWACMEAGCAWGLAVNLPDIRFQWLLTNSPDLYHTFSSRYPVQLLGMLLASVTALFGAIRSHHVYHDTLALILYCAGAAMLTLLRGDSVPMIGQIRVDTIQNLSIALTLGGVRWQHSLRPSLTL